MEQSQKQTFVQNIISIIKQKLRETKYVNCFSYADEGFLLDICPLVINVRIVEDLNSKVNLQQRVDEWIEKNRLPNHQTETPWPRGAKTDWRKQKKFVVPSKNKRIPVKDRNKFLGEQVVYRKEFHFIPDENIATIHEELLKLGLYHREI